MATQVEMRSVGLNLQVLLAVGSTCTMERIASVLAFSVKAVGSKVNPDISSRNRKIRRERTSSRTP
jgi:hypothetical protein